MMKPKSPKKKHQRKSPVVAVIVERTAPLARVAQSLSEPTSPGTPLPIEPKEQRREIVKMLAEQLGEPKEKRGQIAAIVKLFLTVTFVATLPKVLTKFRLSVNLSEPAC